MKLHYHCLLLFCSAVFFTSTCLMAQKPKVVVKKPVAKPVVPAAKIYANDISLSAKGFVIQEAYLIFNDETKVPPDNKVEVNQQVNLRIVLTTAFKEIEGKVFPGASEKIVLSNGVTILDSEDLFTTYNETGVSPADAKYITLKAVITEIKDKNNYITVFVKLWDKKNTASEITGSYKMYIK